MDSSSDTGCQIVLEIVPIEVAPLDSIEGFPHFVIEYFRKDTHCRLSDRELKRHKECADSWGSEKLEAVYDHNRDYFTSEIEISCDEIRV